MGHRYHLLGPVEVDGAYGPVAPETPKVAAVLALLLGRANQAVATPVIIEELWDTEAPKSANTTVQTYIYLLRRFLRDQGADDGGDPLRTDAAGYTMHVGEHDLDVTTFERLALRGNVRLEAGQADEALDALAEAISLWQGPALANVPRGPSMDALAAHLDESLMRVRQQHAAAQLMLGRYRDVVVDLTMLATDHPLCEWVHGMLAEALCRTGRRADALKLLRRLREDLAEQLGSRPSDDLARLELDVLNDCFPIAGLTGPETRRWRADR